MQRPKHNFCEVDVLMRLQKIEDRIKDGWRLEEDILWLITEMRRHITTESSI